MKIENTLLGYQVPMTGLIAISYRSLILLLPSPIFFEIFQTEGGSDFSHKKGGGDKQGGTLSLISILTNPFQSYLSLSKWWCVFCLFTPSVSIPCVSWKCRSLTESNQHMTSTSQSFLKNKDFVEHCNINFDISKLLIQYNIYLYIYVSLLALCVLSVFIFV